MKRELELAPLVGPVFTDGTTGKVMVRVMLRGPAWWLVWLLGLLHLVRYDLKASIASTVLVTTGTTTGTS